jgi:hypothetical protein
METDQGRRKVSKTKRMLSREPSVMFGYVIADAA